MDEAAGDVLKTIEVVEFACGAPQMMKGESLMNVSTGYDTVQFREPLAYSPASRRGTFRLCFRRDGWLPSASSLETALC